MPIAPPYVRHATLAPRFVVTATGGMGKRIVSRSRAPHFATVSRTALHTMPQGHIVHYSHYYLWLRQQESVLEACRISMSDAMQLTPKHLRIRYEKRWRDIPLNQIEKIQVSFKRLILPLIIGGIVAPLSIVALLKGLMGPMLGMAIAFTGTMLLYYGLRGAHQIKIDLKQQFHLHFFAETHSPQLDAFVAAVNRQVAPRRKWQW